MSKLDTIYVKEVRQRCPVCLGTNITEKPDEQGNCAFCRGELFVIAQIERSWQELKPSPANVRSIEEARAKRQAAPTPPPAGPGGAK